MTIELILWAIFINLFTATLAYIARPLWEFLLLHKKPGLSGNWYGIIHPNSPNIKEYVIQRIEFSRGLKSLNIFKPGFGKLRMKLIECSHGYNWEATATISDNKYLLGEWWSVKPGAYSRGTFTLVISPHCDFLYGYAAAMNDQSTIVLKKWVIARNKDSIEKGLKLLGEHRITENWKNNRIFQN